MPLQWHAGVYKAFYSWLEVSCWLEGGLRRVGEGGGFAIDNHLHWYVSEAWSILCGRYWDRHISWTPDSILQVRESWEPEMRVEAV